MGKLKLDFDNPEYIKEWFKERNIDITNDNVLQARKIVITIWNANTFMWVSIAILILFLLEVCVYFYTGV